MKRVLTIGLALGAAFALSASSLAATTKAQIVDPMNDANFVNDQGTGDGSFGDEEAAGAGTVSDILEISFSNDAKNLYILIGTQAAPPAATGIGFRIRANPDASGAYCLVFEAFYSGANNTVTSPVAHFIDKCNGGEVVPLEVLGTQLVIPRSLSKAFAKGAKLTKPQAQSFLWTGTYPQGAATGYPDTTKVGTDFVFKK